MTAGNFKALRRGIQQSYTYGWPDVTMEMSLHRMPVSTVVFYTFMNSISKMSVALGNYHERKFQTKVT
jgi:hypothetical protein